MGSPASEPCREPNEAQHLVTLGRPFELAATEATQGAFASLMGYNPSRHGAADPCAPVDTVTWDEAAAFCNGLSEGQGIPPCYACTGAGSSARCVVAPAYTIGGVLSCPGYRLPSEAEWEYGYRAGSQTASYAGPIASCEADDPTLEEIAWYRGNAGMTTHPVAEKAPNAWGIHDMAGSLWEWTHDWYSQDLGAASATDPVGPSDGTTKVIRGGCFGDWGKDLRAGRRWFDYPDNPDDSRGFRCARTLPAPTGG